MDMSSTGIDISIIIPVYNGKNKISKALNSVLKQNFSGHKIEVIMVDDGSKDGSFDYLESIKKAYETREIMLVALKKKNEGVALTRNYGLKKANGKYIMFLDQDDWIEDKCLETLWIQAEKTNADLIIGGVNMVDDDGRIIETWNLDPAKEWNKYRITAPWGRLFRKKIIDENNLCFFNTKISEDLYFNMLFFSYAEKIDVISYVGYNWVQDKLSESHNNWKKISEERNPLRMLNELENKMGTNGYLKNKREEKQYFFTKYLIWYLLYCGKNCTAEETKILINNIFEWLDIHYPDYKKYSWKKLGYPNGERISVKMTVSLTILLYPLKLLPIFLKIYREI